MRLICVGLAVAAVIQPPPFAMHFRHVDRAHAPHLLGDDEVGPRLLLARLDLHQHDFGGIVIAGDRIGHQRVIAVGVEAVEKHAQRGRQAKRVTIRLRDGELESIERRKRLQLDELRLDRAVGGAHQAEINLQERRQRFRAVALEAIGHGAVRGGHRVGVVEDLVDELDARRCQRRHQRVREEAGRLADRKAERRAGPRLQPPDEIAILRLGPRLR